MTNQRETMKHEPGYLIIQSWEKLVDEGKIKMTEKHRLHEKSSSQPPRYC